MVDGKECGAYTDVCKNAFLVDGGDGDGCVGVCVCLILSSSFRKHKKKSTCLGLVTYFV